MLRYQATLEHAVLNACKLCRIYFPASATQEILDECKPHLCPFNEADMSEYLSTMEIFLPICVKDEEAPISYDLWFSEFMDLWKSCINDNIWENSMMSLISNLSGNNVGKINFEPYIPIMYARFSRSFQLPVHYKMRVSSKSHSLDVSAVAVWIVSTLNHKTETSFDYLEKFMHMIRSFLYSANMGRWSSKLKELINKLSFYFVGRVYFERYRPKSWEKEVPEDFKLSDADIDRFVVILKPCLELAMFSRRISSDVNYTFQHLASLRPHLIIPMTLEKLYASLDSLTEPHRLIAAMSAVISVSRHMAEGAKHNYPEGPTHIIPLLMAVLPGIDPNDFRKCFTTFHFITQFICMIPIINSSEAGKHYEDLTEEEHIICEATAGFEDFVMQFIDRVCVWVESCSLDFIRPEQQAGELNVRGGMEFVSEHAMTSVITVILRQCSPEIFTAALKKVFNFVTGNVLEVDIAGRLTAFLCGSFSKVNPKESLKLFVPYLCDKIECLLDENANAETEEHLDGEILYNMLILSEVVDGRDEIKQYVDRLMRVLDKTLHVSCVQATKISVHMLTFMMSTLATTQPIERKSSNKSYSSHVKDFLPVREWGYSIQAKELKVDWYTPGEPEIQTIQLLTNKYLTPELDKMNKYCSEQLTLSRSELRNSLKIINAVMAAHTVLPIWEESPVMLTDTIAPVPEFQAAETKIYNVTLADGSNVRKTIADTMHKVQKRLLSLDEGDTKSLFVIANLYNVLLFNKVHVLDLEQNWKNFTIIKKISQNRLLDKKRHLRHLLIDRATLQQLIRIENSGYTFTETHRQILFDLFQLGVSRYRDVRVYSQSKLLPLINYFPYSYTLLTEKFKEILQMNTEENHEQFKGCLYILNGSKNSPIIIRQNWKFISEIWPLLVNSMPSEKPSIINLITQISESVSTNFLTPGINFELPDQVLQTVQKLYYKLSELEGFSEEKNKASSMALKSVCEAKKNDYIRCVDLLLKACHDRNLHWRYHLLAIGFLRDMVHLDVHYSQAVVKYFLEALISDSILIRKIAMKVVVFILIQNKLKYTKVEIDPLKFSNSDKNKIFVPGHREDNQWLLYDSNNLPKNSKDWNELRYMHDSSLGYCTWPKSLKVYSSPDDQPRVAESVDKMSPEQKEIHNFFSNEENISKLIYYFSLEDKKGKDRFNGNKALIFKYLSKLLEDKVLDIFLPHLEKLAVEKQESSQRCAAEIICGLIRGSKHWSYEKTEKLWFNLIPIFQGANQNILLETIQDWSACLSSSLILRDPRRFYWLLEFLLDDPLSDPTSLIAGVKLHLLSNAIYLQPWRNCELYNRLLVYLKKHMYHPFQLIRAKISTSLKIIFTRDYVAPGGTINRNPKIKAFFDDYMPDLNWLYDDALKKIDNNIGCDKPNAQIDLQREEALRLFKIVSKFITGSLICPLNLYMPVDFYRILPLTCVLQSNDVDDEIQPMCMNLLALLAQTVVVDENMPSLLKILESSLSCPLWSARSTLAEFLSTFVFHNVAILSSRDEWVNKVQSFVMILLEDPQPEVRDNACKFLSGLLHCNFLPSPSDLLVDFKLKARTKLRKSRVSNSIGSVNNSNLITRHAGVLGLCAFISSTPYDVPEFLPDIFGVLGPHLNDPQPIPSTIRKTLGDFKRTHQDNWEVHKMQFTEEQLLVLRDLTMPPSYYV
ncbi:hypothetical protein HHI36_000763 [Cryptolaemus montrouzieri]|uniref:Proteasome activator complex subunit 4 n=1 Tax=Cryptolaemus montrouzieri TaxID=559131 RepID=A0ABD2P6B6_9CUCU